MTVIKNLGRHTWLNKCEDFFWGYHTLEEDKG
jgi:hypothetical protein